MKQYNKKTLLIKNADYIVTMSSSDMILRNASIYIEGNEIQEIDSKKTRADTIIDGRGKIVLPGFINCHHHMFQCGLRGKPELQNQEITRWISIVCDYAISMNEELMYYSALANMAELLLYGC
ncbi:MAG: 8-oxoguanine deaminase, partial [Patescibacteria group bacterium]